MDRIHELHELLDPFEEKGTVNNILEKAVVQIKQVKLGQLINY